MRLASFTNASVLLATLLLAPGCGPADVEGSWSGEWHSSIFTGALTMVLTQDEDTFEGNFEIGGTWCVGSGTVEGTLERRDFKATMSNGAGGEVSLDGTVGNADEKIEGTFNVTGGGCDDSVGRFDLKRE